MDRQAGSSQRIHVHAAYVFQALMAKGWTLFKRSGASFIKLEVEPVALGLTCAAGCCFLRKFSGMVRFAPQYVHAIRITPAAGSLGPPQVLQGKVSDMQLLYLLFIVRCLAWG